MVRNVVLALSSLAILALLLLGYTHFFRAPGAGQRGPVSSAHLPERVAADAERIEFGPEVSVPGGRKIVYRVFDERTGLATDVFSCQDWQPVAGTPSELRVTAPELAMLLPSGMIAAISADEGQLGGERIERSQFRPRRGWLAGHVRIVIDRETRPDRTPRDERPADLITIAVDRLDFDLERGRLHTEDRVQVESWEFAVAGRGLDLVWNQADNRVETLTIARGEEFVLYTPGGLLENQEPPEGADAGTASQPAVEPSPAGPAKPPPKRPRLTAYVCTLAGGVQAEQYRDDQPVGGLTADVVELLFDVGGGAGRTLRVGGPRAPTTQPQRGNRLVVRWDGSLQLGPTSAPAAGEHRRLHFVARGTPAILTRADRSMRCQKVEYHDETQRIWIEPIRGESVQFALGANLSATAAGVFVDQRARLVKLLGDIELRSERGHGDRTRQSTIACNYWAELHLAAGEAESRPVFDVAPGFERLESATFVGDVRVDLGRQDLTGHRLDVVFRPGSGDESIEDLLDAATATGAVALASGEARVDCEQLELVFDRTPEGNLYPRRMDAAGSVAMTNDQVSIVGDRVSAALAPASDRAARERGALWLQTLDVDGRAEALDRKERRAARGTHFAISFEGRTWRHAVVHGTPHEPGLLHADPYTVRGARVDLDHAAQTLHVDGPSRLWLKARRTLQGRQQDEPVPIAVDSRALLHVDLRDNTVRFVGDVVATSGDEHLHGDTLTLSLEDLPAPASQPQRRARWSDLWRELRKSVGRGDAAARRDDLFDLDLTSEDEAVRKEPRKLVAENALVVSESFNADDAEPVVHASISAPLLEVDLPARQIVTTGLTQLLMTDRRRAQDSDATGTALGVPSALLTSGPSQTAMQCEKRMVYTLGPDGPARRDTVVFEAAVLFVHRAGREMINLEQVLPDVVAHPELLETLESRNVALDAERLECWFAADPRQATPQRGGALTTAPLRLASLAAAGSVYLRDQGASEIRELNAAAVEFDRENGWVRVQGRPAAAARLYVEDPATGRSEVHVGQEMSINLRDGTIRAGTLEGELRRP